MFGLGFWEILMIALVVIVFVPPKDMPKVFSRIGKIYGEIRSFNRSVRNTMRTLELDVDREYRAAKRKQEKNAGADEPQTADRSHADAYQNGDNADSDPMDRQKDTEPSAKREQTDHEQTDHRNTDHGNTKHAQKES